MVTLIVFFFARSYFVCFEIISRSLCSRLDWSFCDGQGDVLEDSRVGLVVFFGGGVATKRFRALRQQHTYLPTITATAVGVCHKVTEFSFLLLNLTLSTICSSKLRLSPPLLS